MNIITATLDALKKGLIIRFTPSHAPPGTLPTWMFSKKKFLQIILAAKWLVRHSSTSPNQLRQHLSSLLHFSFFYGLEQLSKRFWLTVLGAYPKDFLWPIRLRAAEISQHWLEDKLNTKELKIKWKEAEDRNRTRNRWRTYRTRRWQSIGMYLADQVDEKQLTDEDIEQVDYRVLADQVDAMRRGR